MPEEEWIVPILNFIIRWIDRGKFHKWTTLQALHKVIAPVKTGLKRTKTTLPREWSPCLPLFLPVFYPIPEKPYRY